MGVRGLLASGPEMGVIKSTPSKHSLFSDRQKAFFKVLRFAAHWAFGRVELNLAMPTQHLATPPREKRVAVSHVLGYCLPSRYAGLERSWSGSIANRTSA